MKRESEEKRHGKGERVTVGNISETVFNRECLPGVSGSDHLPLRYGRLYADKAYIDAAWAESLEKDHAVTLLTPRKRAKGDTLISGDTFSTFVSSIRQPIEYFFNWLNRLTCIQSASMVRSLSGLLLHIFARIAAALAALLFKA